MLSVAHRDGSTEIRLSQRQGLPNPALICLGHKKINLSTVFAGQAVGIKEVHDDI